LKAIEKRKNQRYGISEYIKDDSYQDINIEIKTDKTYHPRIIDISINGLGFVLDENGDYIDFNEFEKLENYFISINLIKKTILVEVKKIWSIITEKAGKKILTGGLAFSVISPDDRLIIAEYINTIRS
jgi:hypothetical protein